MNDEKKTLMVQLAVLTDVCTLAAADAVCGEWEIGNVGWDTGKGLLSLLDKRLLRETAGTEDEPRFSMLEMIREYALERLVTSGDADTIRHRHAAYYLSLSEAAERHLNSLE